MPTPRLPADVIERAKDVRLEDIAAARGLKLKASGVERLGPCPLCGGTDRFAINTKKQVWHCRGCVKGGDGIKLVQHLDGLRFPQAVEHLAGIRSTDSEPPPRARAQRQQATPQVSYDYKLEDGTPYLRVNRNEDKSFFQQCWNGSAWVNGAPDGPKIPYRLPELLQAEHDTVVVVEGEKDADNLAALGFVVTTNSGGARNWSPDLNKHFEDRDIYILPDNDDAGRDHCAQVVRNLFPFARGIQVVNLPGLPAKGDVSDWIKAGGTADQLVELMRSAPKAEEPKEEAASTKAKSGLDVICVADVKPTAIEWLWPNWIAIGKVHVLAGEGGKGKSTILCDLAARTTTGEQWPDGESNGEVGSVIILAAEDAVEDTVAPRLMAARADLSRVFVVRSVLDENRRRSFNLQADLERLEAEIKKCNNVRLVIIDPVSSYLGKVDSHKNADVRSVLEPLGEMAARLRVAIICNNHFSKNAGSANNKIIGSVAFVNQARAAFIVTQDPEDETRMLLIPSKMNIAPLKHGMAYRIEGCLVDGEDEQIITSRIMYESTPITVTADQALAAIADGGNRSDKAEAIEFLTDALSKGPVAVKEVRRHATEAGISPKSLRTAREAMGVKTEKAGFEGGWVWTNPKVPKVPEGAQDAHVTGRASSGEEGHLRGNSTALPPNESNEIPQRGWANGEIEPPGVTISSTNDLDPAKTTKH
jgi:putative DNA primase/helicase